jgi:ABC-type transporter Mla maintaining outer membrane lipid asymmetry ATPase subunit MlaF
VETRFDHPYLLQGEVAWIPQEGGLIANLTLLQNVALPLRFVRRKGRGDAEEMARLFLNRVGLQEKASLRPHALSLRERRLGALARSAALGPRLWLVDRLLDGLEPGSLSLAGNLLEEVLRPEEVTLLLVGDETGSGGLAHKAVRLEEGSVHQEEPE